MFKIEIKAKKEKERENPQNIIDMFEVKVIKFFVRPLGHISNRNFRNLFPHTETYQQLEEKQRFN